MLHELQTLDYCVTCNIGSWTRAVNPTANYEHKYRSVSVLTSCNVQTDTTVWAT